MTQPIITYQPMPVVASGTYQAPVFSQPKMTAPVKHVYSAVNIELDRPEVSAPGAMQNVPYSVYNYPVQSIYQPAAVQPVLAAPIQR